MRFVVWSCGHDKFAYTVFLAFLCVRGSREKPPLARFDTVMVKLLDLP